MGQDCALRCCGFVQESESEHLKGLIIYWDNTSLGKTRHERWLGSLSRFPLEKNWEERLLNEILDAKVPTVDAQ